MENNIHPSVPAPITLEDLHKGRIFETKSLRSPHWMQDGMRFSVLEKIPDTDATGIWMHSVENPEPQLITPLQALQLPPAPGEDPAAAPRYLPIPGMQWSPDENSILIASLPARRSSTPDSQAHLFNLHTNTTTQIAAHRKNLRCIKWAPDSRHIGYVSDDELFVLNTETGEERQLTFSASPTAYNGRFGWVYEEELGLADGWKWSPNGGSIAYWHVDESQVPAVDLPIFTELHQKPERTRYPKAGDLNPVARIGVVHLHDARERPATIWLNTGPDPECYLARMQWTPRNTLLIQKLNRPQNRLDLLEADPHTGVCRIVHAETAEKWLELHDEVCFAGKTNRFLWLTPRSGYMHLWLADLDEGLLHPITEGEWEVTTLCGLDAEQKMALFQAALPSPTERQLYLAPIEAKASPIPITTEPGSHSALCSHSTDWFLHTFSSCSSPPAVSLHHLEKGIGRVLVENTMPSLDRSRLAETRFFKIELAEGLALNALCMLPPQHKAEKPCPVLMYTYGGPGSQVVRNEWGGGFDQVLASAGIACVRVDGRGSGMRGLEFEQCTWKRMGILEAEDQIAAAHWLAQQPWANPKQIAIWGWSYGGFMACNCILRGAEIFCAAAAVAPVTHWSLYDSIYTERYMQTPAENPEGYAETSPIPLAEKLQGRFLLMHGSNDDNVHMQNAMRLAAEFQRLGKPFEMMIYPGKRHGMEGVHPHVHATLLSFFRRAFNLPEESADAKELTA